LLANFHRPTFFIKLPHN